MAVDIDPAVAPSRTACDFAICSERSLAEPAADGLTGVPC